jgi:hypothetical protein
VKLLRLGPYIAGGLASIALLAGCSAGGSQSSALGSSAVNPAQVGTHAHRISSLADLHLTPFPYKKVHQVHRKSWVSKGILGAPRLLFITDPGQDIVDIYSMPTITLKGQITTGLLDPEGACSDHAGDIWIADTGDLLINKYDRTGALIGQLTDPSGYPGSCAVAPNGDLAVTNLIDITFNPAGVLVYPNAQEPPNAELRDPDIDSNYFAGYDPSGNLYVDGTDSNGAYVLAESLAGSGTLSSLTITGGAIFFPGMVQWNKVAGDLVLGDQRCGNVQSACLYSASVSGPNADITATTNLLDSAGNPVCDMAQGVIGPLAKMGAAGSSFNACTGDPNSVDRWHFPAGGLPTNSNTTALVDPVGAALSTK